MKSRKQKQSAINIQLLYKHLNTNEAVTGGNEADSLLFDGGAAMTSEKSYQRKFDDHWELEKTLFSNYAKQPRSSR